MWSLILVGALLPSAITHIYINYVAVVTAPNCHRPEEWFSQSICMPQLGPSFHRSTTKTSQNLVPAVSYCVPILEQHCYDPCCRARGCLAHAILWTKAGNKNGTLPREDWHSAMRHRAGENEGGSSRCLHDKRRRTTLCASWAFGAAIRLGPERGAATRKRSTGVVGERY